MRYILLFCLLAVSASLTGQTIISSIQSGGLTREYRLYKPSIYNGATAVPLIINLHGYGSSALEQEFYGSFHSIADTANFLVVMPSGTIDAQGSRFWNTFGGPSTVDDVAFISDLIDTLSSIYNIDPMRIYSTGMSNGGFMSYTLACELNHRITAIASVTGSMIVPNLSACNPARPVPVMEIHGTVDNVVPYNGGTSLDFVAIPELVDAWVDFNNCSTTPQTTDVPNTNTTDGCTAQRFLYTGGDNGSTVEHYKITGGGHTWPGAAFNIGVTNKDINASAEIWRFFRQYRLDQLSAGNEPAFSATSAWSVYPNPARDYVVIESKQNIIPQNIVVTDAAGQIVITDAYQGRIHTAGWAKGVYFVKISEANHVYVLKFIVQQ